MRTTLQITALLPAVLAAFSCGSPSPGPIAQGHKADTVDDSELNGVFEYVIVGSGAGGGPLAARLARQGHKVLLLEAGQDRGDSPNYQVPLFHSIASEDPSMSWSYYVKHYDDPQQAAQDPKMVLDDAGQQKGIFYPRGATLGGSTAVNAMITVYPHDSDWNDIATLTGDSSWSSANMRQYFVRIENNRYLRPNDSRDGHGFSGWLQTEQADPGPLASDASDLRLLKAIGASAAALGRDISQFTRVVNLPDPVGALIQLAGFLGELNAATPGRDTNEGMFSVPLAMRQGRRNGTRDWIRQTQADFPNNLRVVTGALVTRVVFAGTTDSQGHYQPTADDKGRLQAVGVEFIQGDHLYRADPQAPSSGPPPPKRIVTVKREVVLSAGAFNSPQLLMLSGVGPRDQLTRLGIDTLVELPGVGSNLQDRYEVGVVSQAGSPFGLLKGCRFKADASDPCYTDWQDNQEGAYVSNGALVGVTKRSTPDKPLPDLFLFGFPGEFAGYKPGYSQVVTDGAHLDRFTWTILKAHTNNRSGVVALRTADPRDAPDINFHFFGDTDPNRAPHDNDLQAVVEGVKFARSIADQTCSLWSCQSNDLQETLPGRAVASDSDLGSFVRNQAWGHHASGTCAIGPDKNDGTPLAQRSDPHSVLDSEFHVLGTTALRVVDASVFPRIPGYFIVVPMYMVSEKAADVILQSAN
jgi:choline dehydrogenase